MICLVICVLLSWFPAKTGPVSSTCWGRLKDSPSSTILGPLASSSKSIPFPLACSCLCNFFSPNIDNRASHNSLKQHNGVKNSLIWSQSNALPSKHSLPALSSSSLRTPLLTNCHFASAINPNESSQEKRDKSNLSTAQVPPMESKWLWYHLI